MTIRQRILKTVYPIWMWLGKLGKKKGTTISPSGKTPPVSFYTLSASLNNGSILDFSTLRGRKVLIVNTASNCGFTNQYDDLQKLYREKKDHLSVIGFPANDFKEQEKGTDEEIAQFCKINYGVSFPLSKKSTVLRSPDQNSVFKWLTNASANGWNNKVPPWNFTKYLVNEDGILTHYFDPAVSPVSKDVLDAIGK